jgi:predicted nucleotidyltransferase
MEDIRAVVRELVTRFQPEQVVLFGSWARGQAAPDSDVDLLVILPFRGSAFRVSLEMMRKIRAPFALDLLARRPDDTARRYREGDPLIREALDHGMVLHGPCH